MYISFDILYRYLKHLGYDVQYVRNFTGASTYTCCANFKQQLQARPSAINDGQACLNPVRIQLHQPTAIANRLEGIVLQDQHSSRADVNVVWFQLCISQSASPSESAVYGADIDDKIIARAKLSNEDPLELSRR